MPIDAILKRFGRATWTVGLTLLTAIAASATVPGCIVVRPRTLAPGKSCPPGHTWSDGKCHEKGKGHDRDEEHGKKKGHHK